MGKKEELIVFNDRMTEKVEIINIFMLKKMKKRIIRVTKVRLFVLKSMKLKWPKLWDDLKARLTWLQIRLT